MTVRDIFSMVLSFLIIFVMFLSILAGIKALIYNKLILSAFDFTIAYVLYGIAKGMQYYQLVITNNDNFNDDTDENGE